MKKKLTRVLAALLIAMMLIPTFAAAVTFAASAEEETIDISDIVNVYKLKQLDAAPPMDKTAGAMNDSEPTSEEGMVASEPFAVTRTGDKYLYVGPCPDPESFDFNDYILYWYKKDGSYCGAKKTRELRVI